MLFYFDYAVILRFWVAKLGRKFDTNKLCFNFLLITALFYGLYPAKHAMPVTFYAGLCLLLMCLQIIIKRIGIHAQHGVKQESGILAGKVGLSDFFVQIMFKILPLVVRIV